MALVLHIHPDDPQKRLISQAVESIKNGGVCVLPTDAVYALGCRLGDKSAADRIRQIRRLDEKHHFTLMCRDLSEISTYAVIDNSIFRLLKANTPGPYTFLLKATPEVPKRLQHPKRKTIGIRISANRIDRALLDELGEPLMTSSLILPEQEDPLTDPEEIAERLGVLVDIVIDGGYGGLQPTSVIDLAQGSPTVIRKGLGDLQSF